jgi:hypothetical protein
VSVSLGRASLLYASVGLECPPNLVTDSTSWRCMNLVIPGTIISLEEDGLYPDLPGPLDSTTRCPHTPTLCQVPSAVIGPLIHPCNPHTRTCTYPILLPSPKPVPLYPSHFPTCTTHPAPCCSPIHSPSSPPADSTHFPAPVPPRWIHKMFITPKGATQDTFIQQSSSLRSMTF